jgi:hypothetical protein
MALTFEEILREFGTEKARHSFLELCNSYYLERSKDEALEQAGLPAPNTRRAEIHNSIMEVVQKLAMSSSRPFPDRAEVGRSIMAHFRSAELP